MRFIGELLLAIFLGSSLGLAAGYLTYGRGHTAGEFVAPAQASLAPAAPAAAAAVAGAVEPVLGAATPAVPVGDAVLAPEVVAAPKLPAHGQGHFFVIDLRAAQLKSLAVHQGSLAYDGPGEFTKVLNAKKIAVLRGPRANVELLHFGLDKQGYPLCAHIRTTERSPVEGVIALFVENKQLTLVEDASHAPLMPTPSVPVGEIVP